MGGAELLERNKHISDAEIEQDIAATEREIAQMELEAQHFENTPLSLPSARWDRMRARARRDGIAERKIFIERLRNLQELRKAGS